ncbi:MAG: rhodanese-like domain-containing protein [Ancalomicrobiaceae bacterium]|nr:rhodanese-like domain-containing protein [Ancalomicrobiaceae bacterium]
MGLTDFLKSLVGSTGDRTISFADLSTQLKAGAVTVVDVREPNEFVTGTVPGAVNLPLSRFDASALPSGKPVVLICQVGGRSAKALHAALSAGRDDVCHYAGGMSGWRREGGPVA